MGRKCEVTGKTKMKALQRSHALNRTIKFQQPNIQKFWIPGENRWVILKTSANGIRTINKKGIKSVLRELAAG